MYLFYCYHLNKNIYKIYKQKKVILFSSASDSKGRKSIFKDGLLKYGITSSTKINKNIRIKNKKKIKKTFYWFYVNCLL